MNLLLFLLLLAFKTSFATYNGLEGLYEEPTTWVAGRNEFPSTLEEMRSLLGVKNRSHHHLLNGAVKRVRVESDVELPKEFDARKQWPKCGTIKDIANQGSCGSCWAVAVATSFSDRLCIASDAKISLTLSYHQLTTCCRRCGYGCNGGLPEMAWDYFHYHGLVTGGASGCQPYNVARDTKCYTTCTNKNYETPFKKDLHKTKAAYILDADEESIKSDLYKHGSVPACFDVFSDFMYYRSGVYKRTNRATYEGGHAIRIIGWGEENGLKYWLCANSWGSYWGTQGLFKIERGTNQCQIEDRCSAGIPVV